MADKGRDIFSAAGEHSQGTFSSPVPDSGLAFLEVLASLILFLSEPYGLSLKCGMDGTAFGSQM